MREVQLHANIVRNFGMREKGPFSRVFVARMFHRKNVPCRFVPLITML